MILDSETILPGREIPRVYTKDDKDVSPPLRWDQVPDGTATFALVCEDPDAPKGLFTHWVIYDIPAESRQIREGMPREPELESGALQGRNDFGELGWGGPRPPRGDKPHTYHFRLYALDRKLNLQPGASRDQVLDAITGHVLDEVDLPATYQRPAEA